MMSDKHVKEIKGLLIFFFICAVAMFLIIAFISDGVEKKAESKKEKAPIAKDVKLAHQILDSIEDYYLVNKKDHKLVKMLHIEKVKVDTIIIQQYESNN